ncbi:DUF4433 domain-containing protein [Enterovibrio makurazakiensis]|uniref:DarT ssDNA thymidine ADP-ribosyltransferase family protein n=1 Tax=Enterovibrio makurazakiensis TaxID=2910232 RepID=UPI003D1C1129
MTIRDQKLLYHLTAIENVENILSKGLLPRDGLADFSDVADRDILEGREAHDLDKMVPFHFFVKNPFDGRVRLNNPDAEFVYITINREFAREDGWVISPRHPLAIGGFDIKSYDEGMEAIDWKLMDQRDYKNNPESKRVCMAECLSLKAVEAKHFNSIVVETQEAKERVERLRNALGLRFYVNHNPNMFVSRRAATA